MKTIIIILSILFVSCISRIENQNIEEYGKKQIGDNIYIKKIIIGSDRIYMLVDENDKLIINGLSTSYTIKTDKSKIVKSNSIMQ